MNNNIEYKSILNLCKLYYKKENNGAGGCLHIVLEDGNLDYDSIKFCYQYSINNNDADGEILCKKLLRCSMKILKYLYLKGEYDESIL